MPTSNPPAAGTPSFLEGLALESVVDLSSIPLSHTSHTSEENKDIDPRDSKKRSLKEVDPEEVTSSLSGSAKHQETEDPIASIPISSKAPGKPPCLFDLR